ncbi:MAG: ABC transporter substrate-binding protein [Gammaproteobacteria bacterium]
MSGQVFSSSFGQSSIAGQRNPAIDFTVPARLLQQQMSMIQTFMQSSKERDPATVLRFLQDEVIQHFDLDTMAQWIAGKAYSQMEIQEQASFQNRLKEKIFAVIGRELGIFSSQALRLNFFPPRQIGPADVAIVARVFHPQQPPIRMMFKFHHLANQGWKIFDVSINGMSALAYYRRHYQQGFLKYGSQVFLK